MPCKLSHLHGIWSEMDVLKNNTANQTSTSIKETDAIENTCCTDSFFEMLVSLNEAGDFRNGSEPAHDLQYTQPIKIIPTNPNDG